MPELAAPRAYNLPPLVFQPINPASYFNKEPLPQRALDTSKLSEAQASNQVMGAMAKAFAELPGQIVSAYKTGKQLHNTSEIQKRYEAAAKSGDSNALADFKVSGDGNVSFDPAGGATRRMELQLKSTTEEQKQLNLQKQRQFDDYQKSIPALPSGIQIHPSEDPEAQPAIPAGSGDVSSMAPIGSPAPAVAAPTGVADASASAPVAVPAVDPKAIAANGSVFGLTPDGQGGHIQDPQDSVDAAKNIPGFSTSQGFLGANIKDPNLFGAAVPTSVLRNAGVDLKGAKANPDGSLASHVARVRLANGDMHDVPIVDSGTKDGRIDFTLPAYRKFGGPEEKGGGLINGMSYQIVPAVAQNRRDQINAAAETAGNQLGGLVPAMNQADASGADGVPIDLSASTEGIPASADLSSIQNSPEFKMQLDGSQQQPLLAPVNPPGVPEAPKAAQELPKPDKPSDPLGYNNINREPIDKSTLSGTYRSPDGTLVHYIDGVISDYGTPTKGGDIRWRSYHYPSNTVEGRLIKNGYNPAKMTPAAVDAALLSIKDPLRPDTVKDLTARRIPTYDATTGTQISNSAALEKLKADDDATGRDSLVDAKNLFEATKAYTGSQQYKNAFTQASSYNSFKAAFDAAKKSQNGMADFALIDAFIKTQNPGGVVRKGTADMIQEVQAAFDKYNPLFLANKLSTGRILTDKSIANMKKVMDEEIHEQGKYFDETLTNPAREAIKTIGGKPERIVSPYAHVDTKEEAHGAPAPNSPPAGWVKMKAPTGEERYVDPASVDKYSKQGATVIQ